jgi:poly(hydroxyalkanoate) depolymerase family esterase
MNSVLQRLMHATQLTRKGDLQAATAAIQSALAQRAEGAEGVEPQADVVDVEARELPSTATHSQPADAFIDGSFGSGPARRDFKLYIPPAAGAAPLPLVVMLHGCTQDAADFAAGTAMNELARGQGFYVLYPEQSQQANPQRCWNWFKHNHQVRDRGEPATIAGMARKVMAQYPVDPARVYVAGLSAGGAMAAILGDAYPELFAAVGVHSGLPTGAANDVPSAFGAMKSGPQGGKRAASGVPTIVFHGDGDHTVNPVNGDEVIAASVQAGTAVETEQGRSAGGRRYTRSLHRTAGGKVVAEQWVVHGAPHAWAGGSGKGSYTDPGGPDASAEMLRFFRSVR